jgi:hypothetical protein
MIQEKRIVTILKDVAQIEPESDEDGDYRCPSCGIAPDTYRHVPIQDANFPHETTCSIAMAQTVLAEMGMPLSVYKVSYEYDYIFNGVKQLSSRMEYVTGFTEDEAHANCSVRCEHRNVKVEFVREVKP